MPRPDEAHLARVVDYDVPNRHRHRHRHRHRRADHGAEDILDPAHARADAYHERGEEEPSDDQLNTHLRGPGKIPRSTLPELAHQEIWAWLLAHHALSALAARAAQAADIDPDRISLHPSSAHRPP